MKTYESAKMEVIDFEAMGIATGNDVIEESTEIGEGGGGDIGERT